MTSKIVVQPNTYFDSVVLMRIAAQLATHSGIETASLVMGTEANRQVLAEAGLLEQDASTAGPNDLVIVVAGHEEALDSALEVAQELLTRPTHPGSDSASAAPPPTRTLSQVAAEATIAVISTPGQYAAAEAMKALRLGLHAFIFSDNVELADEVELKRFAHERGLLVMGPDCGTAIVNGVPLAFANELRRGNVGLIGASGTGLQQVSTLLDNWGAGVSHVIGVGGRDLSHEVGAISMLDALDALDADEGTDVIVLVSKPPAPEVSARVLRRAGELDKPVIAAFLGAEADSSQDSGITVVPTLDEAAGAALRLATAQDAPIAPVHDVAALAAGRPQRRRFLRALFAGGTFAYEASLLLAPMLGQVARRIDGYAPGSPVSLPEGHLVLDLGGDEFTVGRPHPMIDPSTRLELIRAAAEDPGTGVILLDVVLGHGAAEDPAGGLCDAVAQATASADSPLVVAFVVGTDSDSQGLAAQQQKLRQAGAVVVRSSTHAAWLTEEYVSALKLGGVS
ncbi:acyl-CoA synthetase FdrA [Streptomyces sp. NPDC004227]